MSKKVASATIASESPRTQRMGGFTARSTIPDTLKYFGAIVLSTPLSPAAKPGQFSEAAALPG